MKMDDTKVGKFFLFIFGGLILFFVIILFAIMLFKSEIKEFIKDGLTDDEQISILYPRY